MRSVHGQVGCLRRGWVRSGGMALPQRPHPYHHGALRDAAIAAAVSRLAAGGEELPTVRELAAQIGVTHRALYRHFPAKEALAAAVASAGFAMLAQAIATTTGTSPRHVMEAYVNFAVGHPGLYRFMFSLGAKALMKDPEPGPQVRHVIAIATEAFGRGREDHASRDRVVAAWGLAHGLLDLWRSGALCASAPELAATYILDQLETCRLLA